VRKTWPAIVRRAASTSVMVMLMPSPGHKAVPPDSCD
jgi:hypothetical protein